MTPILHSYTYQTITAGVPKTEKRNLTVMHNCYNQTNFWYFNSFQLLHSTECKSSVVSQLCFGRYLLRTLIGDILHNLRERRSVQPNTYEKNHHLIPHSKKRFQSSLQHSAHGKFTKSRIKWI